MRARKSGIQMQAQIQQGSQMLESGNAGGGGGSDEQRQQHLQQQHHAAAAIAVAHQQRAMAAAAAAALERDGGGPAAIAAAAAAAAAAASAHFDDDDDEDDESAAVAMEMPNQASPTTPPPPGSGDTSMVMFVGRHQHQRPPQRASGTPASNSALTTSNTTPIGAGMQMPVLSVPCCRVEGCGEDLSAAGDYHRRHKVCKMHATSSKVINHGQEQRFCQQCSRFHALSEFDEGKRSCRKRLAGHNERRRRHQPDSLATTSSESPPLPPDGDDVTWMAAEPGRDGATSNKKPREVKARGRGGRRGRTTGLPFTREEALMLRGDDVVSSKRRKPGEEFSFSDSFKGKERGGLRLQGQGDRISVERRGLGEYSKDIDELEIDIADMEQVKEGLDLGEGIIIPPLFMKRDGKPSLLKGWAQEGALENAEEMQQVLDQLRPSRNTAPKNSWQKDDKEAFLHCFWECPKAQPIWRWVARQLSKLRGSKVTLDMKQAVFGARLESWASPEAMSVWKLFRGIILWQIWLARKGKVSNGIQWTSNKVMRAAWVDLMMYAMQDWLEVLKKKEAQKHDDAFELRSKFDNKWLVNLFAGRRAEWTMIWKDPDDVLLD